MRVLVSYGRHSPAPAVGTCRAYTYETGMAKVAVGDIVLVPATWVNPNPQEATVVSLKTHYDGDVHRILRVVEHVKV